MTEPNPMTFNPVELLKSAAAVLDTIPGEYGAEHANILQLEKAAGYLISDLDVTRDNFDKAIPCLSETVDPSIQHIAKCSVCIAGVRQFFDLFF